MNSPSVSPVRKLVRAFTLIELLVVLSIIGILAGLLLPLFAGIQERAHKVQAVNDMRNIKVGIVSYYTDYQKYPINATQQSAVQYGGNDTVYGDPGGLYSSADLFNILRAVADTNFNQDNQLNPSKTVYWPGPLAKSAVHPVNGITTQNFKDGDNVVPQGSLVDPWGNSYVVWIDANRDGDLSVAAHWFYSDIKTKDTDGVADVPCGLPPMGMEFASLGPDGEWGTRGNFILKGSDDIVTW